MKCVMCQREHKSGRMFLVGNPTRFWVCRNHWKDFVAPNLGRFIYKDMTHEIVRLRP